MGDKKVDLDKLRSIGVQPSDRSGTTRRTTDELGNTLTHHWDDDSRQDVTVNARPVKVATTAQGD